MKKDTKINMVSIEIIKHDKEAYEALLNLAMNKCDTAQLVVRNDVMKETSVMAFTEKINQYLIKADLQNEWAGTRLGDGHTALVMHYNVSGEIIRIFKEYANSFFEWVQPSLPEDLSFFKDGREMLINTAHEKQLYIITNDEKQIVNYLEQHNIYLMSM